jgi:hypothetical protein
MAEKGLFAGRLLKVFFSYGSNRGQVTVVAIVRAYWKQAFKPACFTKSSSELANGRSVRELDRQRTEPDGGFRIS